MEIEIKKHKLLTEQLTILLLIDFLLLINDEFLFKEKWLPTFTFSILFLHLGFFISFIYVIKSKSVTNTLNKILTDYICCILLGFISLCFIHNCQVKSDNLGYNFILALIMLFMAVWFGFDTLTNYKKINLIKNKNNL